MIEEAKDHDSPGYLEAMNRLIEGYWRPVFYFIRAKGNPLHQAEDFTQEFFLQFLKRDWLRRVDRRRGRFRTFLLTVLVRFLADQAPNRAAQQKTFDRRLVNISTLVREDDRTFEPAINETAEEIFLKQWAKAVVINTQRCLEIWCESKKRPQWHKIFLFTHFPPADAPRLTQQAMARRFHLSRDQIRYALEQTSRQFAELLRAEVSGQVDSDVNLESEVRELLKLLGK